MNTEPPLLFALSESRAFGDRVAATLGLSLGEHKEREFEDGEHKIRSLENVRNRDVYVIQSLYSDPERSVNDKLCRLLFFLGALQDASAARVSAVLPYLCYARKDRKTKPRDPVTTRYLAQLLESMGTHRVVALEVHNPAAFQNALRCRSDHLEARRLWVDHFAPRLAERSVVVVSPDVGGAKRAEAFRQMLSRRLAREADMAFLEKYRSAGEISGQAVVGDIHDKVAIIVDDLISSGSTLVRAAGACRAAGAREVHAAASHGLFVGDADQTLTEPALDQLVITNTIPPFRLTAKAIQDKLTVLDAAPLFAEAIRRIHNGASLVELVEDNA